MWVPKSMALIRGRRLFEAQHLLEEIRCLKSKLNQVSVTALPHYQLLHQILENAILHPVIY